MHRVLGPGAGRGVGSHCPEEGAPFPKGSAPPTREQAWLEVSFMFTAPGLGAGGDVLSSL